MNFAIDVVEGAPAAALALVEIARDGTRREWTFADVTRAARTLAFHIDGHGVRRGDTVVTLSGNQPDWVAAMVACFRQATSCWCAASSCVPATCAGGSRSASRRCSSLRSAQRRRPRAGRLGRADDPRARRRRLARARAAAGRATRSARPLSDHVHQRHGRRGQGRDPRPALPCRPAGPGRALARARPGRPGLVHGGQRLEQVRAPTEYRVIAASQNARSSRISPA